MFVGLNSGLAISNETAITKEGFCHLRTDSESHTTSLLDNRDCNYRQSSVIVCSLLEIMIIDLFLVALLSFVCLVLTDSSSLVT